LIALLLLAGGLVCVAIAAALLLVDVRGTLSLPKPLLRLWLASRESELAQPAGFEATPLVFRVNPGDSAAAVGLNLAAHGLVRDAELFRNYARYHGLDSQLEAGAYFLNATQTIPDIALTLTDSSKASVTARSSKAGGGRRSPPPSTPIRC
jgi:cell division protein YceG involved in septum cleavage